MMNRVVQQGRSKLTMVEISARHGMEEWEPLKLSQGSGGAAVAERYRE